LYCEAKDITRAKDMSKQSKLEMGKILAGKSTAMAPVSRNERGQKELIECHSNLSQ
jgi:hypothetical protein